MTVMTSAAQKKERVLVMSHGHPDFSLGGGEIAAYNLYKGYKADPNVEQAWFLARVDKGRGPTGGISMRRPDEYLWEQAVHDWHRMKAVHQESLVTWFSDLIRALKPGIVHAHHYAHLGLEYLRVIKQVSPGTRLFMTLHEFMAVCSNNGQMIKTGSQRLCSQSTPDDCRLCFPERSAEDFWLRNHRFQRYFDLVDGFVAPSRFLRDRYVAWGLDAAKIQVIENGHSDQPALPPRELADGQTRNRFAFFGQINPYKGLDVLLEGLHELRKEDRKKIVVEIHAAHFEQQPADLQEKLRKLREPLIEKGVLKWFGPYRPDEIRQRMAAIDWALVPSIWWENSPMVIQEAFACGRPLICSDIGGMAEKVQHGVNGLHVRTGNAMHWAETLLKAATTPGLWEQLREGIRRPLTVAQCTQAHLALFRGGVLPAMPQSAPAAVAGLPLAASL